MGFTSKVAFITGDGASIDLASARSRLAIGDIDPYCCASYGDSVNAIAQDTTDTEQITADNSTSHKIVRLNTIVNDADPSH